MASKSRDDDEFLQTISNKFRRHVRVIVRNLRGEGERKKRGTHALCTHVVGYAARRKISLFEQHLLRY